MDFMFWQKKYLMTYFYNNPRAVADEVNECY